MLRTIMTRTLVALITLLVAPVLPGRAQAETDLVEWSEAYQVTLSDFRSAATQIHPKLPGSSMQSGVRLGFGVQMSTAAFMFTRNFNPKVSATLQRSAAFLTAPDSTTAKQLAGLARYEFDLTELYARKLRKALFENKKTFSDIGFFEPYFQELQAEMAAESSRVANVTQMGQDQDKLREEQERVREEINALSGFCKTCKPPKKRN